jgi:hypothetical protein
MTKRHDKGCFATSAALAVWACGSSDDRRSMRAADGGEAGVPGGAGGGSDLAAGQGGQSDNEAQTAGGNPSNAEGGRASADAGDAGARSNDNGGASQAGGHRAGKTKLSLHATFTVLCQREQRRGSPRQGSARSASSRGPPGGDRRAPTPYEAARNVTTRVTI